MSQSVSEAIVVKLRCFPREYLRPGDPEKTVGTEQKKRYTHVHHDLDSLFGRWSKDKFDGIQGKIDAERRIDPEIWK